MIFRAGARRSAFKHGGPFVQKAFRGFFVSTQALKGLSEGPVLRTKQVKVVVPVPCETTHHRSTRPLPVNEFGGPNTVPGRRRILLLLYSGVAKTVVHH